MYDLSFRNNYFNIIAKNYHTKYNEGLSKAKYVEFI